MGPSVLASLPVQSQRILWALGALVAITIVILLAGWIAHRLMRRGLGDATAPAVPFTLGQLRRLHREGQLSDAEFERARAATIARSLASAGAPPAPQRDDPRARPDSDNPAGGDESPSPD